MIRVPDRGVHVSVTTHNNDFTSLTDWVEASVLAADAELSRTDVIDLLREQYHYRSQDLATERLGSVWSEIRRRASVLGAASPFAITDQFLTRGDDWGAFPAYAFCLVLSLAPRYSKWVEKFGADYTEQGELFELLAASAFERLLPEWRVVVTGWSRDQAVSLPDVAPGLGDFLGEAVHPRFQDYSGKKAHESGLDLVACRLFPDGRGVRPAYLAQCASGADWIDKLHTPELPVWNKIIDFVHLPSKAFFIPFALEADEFLRRGTQVAGLLLDRYRLLSVGTPEAEWVDPVLADRLRAWLTPRVEWLAPEDLAA